MTFDFYQEFISSLGLPENLEAYCQSEDIFDSIQESLLEFEDYSTDDNYEDDDDEDEADKSITNVDDEIGLYLLEY